MNCGQCQGIEEIFSQDYVSGVLKDYRRRGPRKTTRMLIEALSREGVQNATLLDIGGGVGAVQHGLIAAGVSAATDIDASAAYLAAARVEGERRGIAGRVRYEHGNFVELAEELAPADVVTLDRVICCYDDMRKLVSASSHLAQKLYGVVYPRDTWWVRLGIALENFVLRLRRSQYRSYAHPTQAVEALLTANGLKKRYHRQTLVWQVAVFAR
jgi:2-polyprenyl-3-methyl-5-hydroxy-6-metoxy-1,4-benzoquinol methylase